MTTFTVSRNDYVRGSQELIFLTSVHTAPEWVYEYLQAHLDDAITRGFLIFVEGSAMDEPPPNTPSAILHLMEFLRTLSSLYEPIAKGKSIAVQNDFFKHSHKYVVADVSLYEIAVEMRRRGLYAPPGLAEVLGSESYRELIQNPDLEPQKLRRLEDKIDSMKCGALIEQSLPVLVGFRNRKVMNMVEAYMKLTPRGKALVFYGNRHLVGLVKIAEARGWRWSYRPRPVEFDL